MAQVKWTPQSISDVDQIAEYIAKDSIVYASIQTERFFEAVKVLESQIRAGLFRKLEMNQSERLSLDIIELYIGL